MIYFWHLPYDPGRGWYFGDPSPTGPDYGPFETWETMMAAWANKEDLDGNKNGGLFGSTLEGGSTEYE